MRAIGAVMQVWEHAKAVRLTERWRSSTASEMERRRFEKASLVRLREQRYVGDAAVRKAQDAERRARDEVDEIRGALASSGGDESGVLLGRLAKSEHALEAAHEAVVEATRRASLRTMEHVLLLWQYSRQWRVMVQWRVAMVGEQRGSAMHSAGVAAVSSALKEGVSGED